MPTSKTIYEAFDGKEFSDEEEAKKYEKDVRKDADRMRSRFINPQTNRYLAHVDPKFIDFIKRYSYDDAWKIMKSLKCSSFMMDSIVEEDFDWCYDEGHC